MAEEIVRRAEAALERGDMGAAVAAKKALGYEIRSQNRLDLLPEYERIYGSIDELINKAGALN